MVCKLDVGPLTADILRSALAGHGCISVVGPGDPGSGEPDVVVGEVDGVLEVRAAAGLVGRVDLATGTPDDVVALVVAGGRRG